jgi:nicotinamide-nucleotide amidase
MKAIVSEQLIPRLKAQFDLPEIINQMIYTQGIPESMLAEQIMGWENDLPSTIKLAYLPSPGRVKLRLSSTGKNRLAMQSAIDHQIDKLKALIPNNIYSAENEDLAAALGELLLKHKATIATAESCTGGYIAHLITRVAGSSAYYKGSIISYANEIKVIELGVKEEDLALFGAVSKEVVEQMALGVKQKMNTDYAISTSGIAGPAGGSVDKSVGTIWIALATPEGVISEKYIFGKQREVNIERTAITALGMLFRAIG